jgi:D-aspartate ligase
VTRANSGHAVRADRGVPALVIKIGRYPLHSGGVAAIRTLGRLGVPVYAITEDGATPAAVSRYCTGRFVWRTTGHEDPELLVDGLREIGRRLGRRSVAIPVDDESAVLLAEHAAALSEYFLFPPVPPVLPRKLADKQRLHELCLAHGVPTPRSMVPSSAAELAAFAAGASFPVVAKNAEVWTRRRAPAVPSTTLLHSADELLALARGGATPSVMLQEYIPAEDSEDWIVQAYCDASSRCLVLGTGIKVRSWPPHTGATSCAYVVANPGLAEQARRFFAEIGFQGIADLDWRLDRRDGQYKLVDFNPRMGNQFRLFQTAAGVDVVRALHLDLTGRPVPAGRQVSGRRIVIEHADLPARLAYRGSGHAPSAAPRHATSTELAWLATDDPVPFLAVLPRLAGPVSGYLGLLRPRRAGPRRLGPRGAEPHDPRRTGLKDFWSAGKTRHDSKGTMPHDHIRFQHGRRHRSRALRAVCRGPSAGPRRNGPDLRRGDEHLARPDAGRHVPQIHP